MTAKSTIETSISNVFFLGGNNLQGKTLSFLNNEDQLHKEVFLQS